MIGVSELLNDPTRRAEAARRQAELRATLFRHLPRHPAQANYNYGCARELQALGQLLALGEDGTQERWEELASQVAEGCALQGKFGLAADWEPDVRRKAEYAAHERAIDCLGIPLCACPAEVFEPSPRSAKGERVLTEQVIEEVWQPARAEVMALTKCRVCGTISARWAT